MTECFGITLQVIVLGFASKSYINQNQAATYAVESDQRLSWHIDRNIGGWRVGSESELNNNTRYYKISLILPFTIPSTTTTTKNLNNNNYSNNNNNRWTLKSK
jgi:hypothetical protein